MHPFHYHPAFGMGFRRGPSRLVWFVIGAATSAWWIKRKDNDKRIFGHCMRPALPPPGSPVVSAPAPNAAEAMIPGAGEQPQQSAAIVRQWQWQWPQNTSEVPQMVNNMPPAGPAMYPPTPGAWSQDAPYRWDQEREHFAKLSKQAADTMTELTESTLDSVLATAESLKAKLVEHKAQRDKQQKILEQQLDEQRKSPPRLV